MDTRDSMPHSALAFQFVKGSSASVHLSEASRRTGSIWYSYWELGLTLSVQMVQAKWQEESAPLLIDLDKELSDFRVFEPLWG